MLSEYRQRFGQFHTCLHREEYLFRSGRKTRRETAHIFSEYSDLFRLSAVEELHAKLEEASEHRETEVASIRRLIAFALENHLMAQAREVSAEIEDYEVSTSHAAEDLRAERLEKLHAGACSFGYENYLAMRREHQSHLGDVLAAQANQFLAKTESRYISALAPLLLREANVSINEATAADLDRLQRYGRFDAFFGRERMLGVYRELFAALGFRTEKQSNVEIDSAARPNKQPQAFCAPICVPDEIKLSVNFAGGQANYREFLRAAGHAQHFAWTSRNLYPEFQLAGDQAVGEAWGMLFENLMLDLTWLTGTFGFVENAEFRHALAITKLMELRRQAAKFTYEIEFHSGKLSNRAGKRYTELMTDAVRARFDEAEHLRDLSDDLRPASFLRAAAFEAQLRDYLKTKFGSRWWASPKAGEMLIDLWNTGQRYGVEELALMIGLGELDFDYLMAELSKDIAG
jgi:hypothetical protein